MAMRPCTSIFNGTVSDIPRLLRVDESTGEVRTGTLLVSLLDRHEVVGQAITMGMQGVMRSWREATLMHPWVYDPAASSRWMSCAGCAPPDSMRYGRAATCATNRWAANRKITTWPPAP